MPKPRIVIGPDSTTPRRRAAGRLLLLLAGGVFGALTAWSLLDRVPDFPGNSDEQAALAAAQAKIERLERRIAILSRGSQVTELANQQLRAQLVELEARMARLTDEVGFYQRLVGAGGSDQGLAVHSLRLEATPSQRVYRFELTLSQNLKKAEQIAGRLELAVEGVSADRAAVLDWARLGVRMDGESNGFAFKYFQQMNGSFELPDDFQPQRVIVSLLPDGNAPQVAQSFVWAELIEEIKDV